MTLEEIASRLKDSVPGCQVETIANASPAGQHSLAIDRDHAFAAATVLRDEFHLDLCSNVTAVDWLDRVQTEKVKTTQTVDGVAKEIEETKKTTIPGYLEAVYHLYSIADRTGPVVIRMRTGNRTDDVTLPSLTPLWRSAEFQEREAFDLFGIHFGGHPDLRRILMWDGFADHPMRRDYVPPADEFEDAQTEAPEA